MKCASLTFGLALSLLLGCSALMPKERSVNISGFVVDGSTNEYLQGVEVRL